MTFEEFFPIWRKSKFFRGSQRRTFRLRFIQDFLECDRTQAAAYLERLDR